MIGRVVATTRSAGLDGVTINLPANGHDLETLALVGQTLGKVIP